MFDFEKLDVYQKVNNLNVKLLKELKENHSIDSFLKDQWKRASTSILLNLAEGTGRKTKADKAHFYVMARGSVFECISILNLLKELEDITPSIHEYFYQEYEEASKMLTALKKSLQ